MLTSGAPGDTIALGDKLLVIDVGRKFTWKSASPSNRATITSTCAGGQGIVLAGGANKVTTIQDFRFTGWASINSFFNITGSGVCFRFTNLYVNGSNSPSAFAWVGGIFSTGGYGPFGLIDHCDLTFGTFHIRQNADSPDRRWTNSHVPVWGTIDNVFVEDCIIHNSTINDGNFAGKVVIRHNQFIVAKATSALCSGWHGRDSGATAEDYMQSFLQGEIYENSFTVDNGVVNYLVMIRGGTALVHHNSLTKIGSAQVQAGAILQTHCAGSAFALEGCRSCVTGKLLTAPLNDSNYKDCQQAGYWPVRGWANAGKSSIDSGSWVNGDSSLTQLDRDFFVSDGESAAPPGYTPYTYPHPLNTGSVPASPSNNTPPLVEGVAVIGQTLAGTPGSWSAYPLPTFSEQWMACDESGSSCSNISSATAMTYVLAGGQLGAKLKLAVTATNSEGSATAYSGLTGVVVAPGSENVLVNPGFESFTGAVDVYNDVATWPGWTVDNSNGFVFPSTDKHSGDHAYRVYRNSDSKMSIRQNFAVTPGDVMTASFWSKNDVPGHGPSWAIYDVTHSGYIYGPATVSSSSYAKTTLKWTVPAGCLSAQIVWSGVNLGGAENMYIDDAVIAPPASSQELTTPTPSAMASPPMSAK